jgi:hypothetical protein
MYDKHAEELNVKTLKNNIYVDCTHDFMNVDFIHTFHKARQQAIQDIVRMPLSGTTYLTCLEANSQNQNAHATQINETFQLRQEQCMKQQIQTV